MTIFKIAKQSLIHFWRSNLAIALGVAAATAVLTGALIVGDSMRSSLRNLTLDRLGRIDEMLVSDGFFRSELAAELSQSDTFKENYSAAVPAILFPNGTVEFEASLPDNDRWVSRASNVNVIGVSAEFWALSGDPEFEKQIAQSDDGVIINRALARQLGAGSLSVLQQGVTLRIPKPSQLPADSSLGKKDDLVESLVELPVVAIIENEGLGRFSLHPSQIDSPNIYVPIETLQESLDRGALKHKADQPFCNVVFLAGTNATAPPKADTTEALKDQLRPSMDDFGLKLKQVQQRVSGQPPVFQYYSLSSDRLVVGDEVVDAAEKISPAAKSVFTYLAKDIRLTDKPTGVPFSMVSAIDFDDEFALLDSAGNRIPQLADDEIVLNEWTAENIGAKVGDSIVVTYFEPETTHGDQVERQADFKLVAIAGLTEPLDPFSVRRGVVTAAVFDRAPTLANDPDLTPEVPGVTDAETIDNWDLPFKTDNLRAEDDDYWNKYRTTPKAFVNLSIGRKLWRSRFGVTTSLRIPAAAGTSEKIESELLAQIHSSNSLLGFELVPVKRNALAASSGSTPFDALFLALSMFVIASALILVTLLFRLMFQQRASEVGVLLAMGLDHRQIGRLWLSEMLLVAAIGVVLGLLLGVGYAAVMIHGLKTWWVGAISQPVLDLHVSPLTIVIGLVCGLLVCLATIWYSIRRAGRYSIRGMLAGELREINKSKIGKSSSRGGRSFWIAVGCVVLAVVLVAVATQLGGEPQAGAFMGAGFMMLAAMLLFVYRSLVSDAKEIRPADFRLSQLASLNGRRNPLRSTLTIGLVSVAAFLIMAVSSFRLSPTEEGTAGFDFVATSSQPVFANFNDVQQQVELLGEENALSPDARVYSMRYKPGQDASCNNLYQSTRPQVIGVPQAFIESFDAQEVKQFRWASVQATNDLESGNPWHMLNQKTDDGSVPVIIDKNTANYSLKIFATGGEYKVSYDNGDQVSFRVVGFLENSVMQGSLIVSEDNFKCVFPSLGGYRYFMGKAEKVDVKILEDRLGDQGFDARSATQMLADFQTVQNTYISTFQTLGALGLLLGTFGLAVVQIRSVLERRRELALLQSVGFTTGQLSRLVLMENSYLLLVGLAVGVGAAVFATLPHYLFGSASVPWATLATLFGVIAVVGVIAAFLASRIIVRMPLVGSLRV